MDPKIQDLVEEYFKRPLTPEEGQRLSEWLSNSPEETQRFAQRMEILNAQALPLSPNGEVRLKDLGTAKPNRPWIKTTFWVFLPLMALFLYWRLSSPLAPEVPNNATTGPAGTAQGPAPGPVKVFQAKKSLPLPQISTPVPFKGGQDPDPKNETAKP